jgi:hypothetical protein
MADKTADKPARQAVQRKGGDFFNHRPIQHSSAFAKAMAEKANHELRTTNSEPRLYSISSRPVNASSGSTKYSISRSSSSSSGVGGGGGGGSSAGIRTCR